MPAKLIVFLENSGDQRFGEVSVFDTAAEAVHLVETLLEAGYDPQRIRVFAGAEMEARVSLRPVVALVSGDQEEASERGAPDALEGEIKAVVGEERKSEAEPPRPENGSLLGVPARVVEMMPEMLH